MKRLGIITAIATMGLMFAGAPAQLSNVGPVVVEANHQPSGERQAPPAAPERVAMREQQRDDRSYGMRPFKVLDKHKNRAGGERAHRKWRKRKARGRA